MFYKLNVLNAKTPLRRIAPASSKIVHAQLAIPTELSILCGLAIGYPDPEFPANKLHIAREPIGENVVFLDN